MPATDSGVEAWKEQTSAFDRVRSVAQTITQPRSAPWIADRAAVAENTARRHLDRLVDMNLLVSFDREKPITYAPDPLHTRLQTIRNLLEEYDHEGLITLKAELQGQIESWSDEYGVDSPAELRELAAETTTADETAAVRHTASDWEVAEYRLGIVEDAIDNYDAYSRPETVST
ncbi:DUF7342 family protein [Halopiger djelfimassiliensis]|uniref:DUF7342 family protein n=1 Tax=Halopiger djelfimassiliensis TaxID=1293047 RepID=UPI000677C03D|nr:transcriptional regulator [Halopiger djelfimassiliensis]